MTKRRPKPIRICRKCEAVAENVEGTTWRCKRDTCRNMGGVREFPTLQSQTQNPRKANKGMAAGGYHIRPHTGS